MRVVLLAPRHIPWHSMEEILPSIERLWRRAAVLHSLRPRRDHRGAGRVAARERFELEVLRIDDKPDIHDLGPLLKADLAAASFLSPAVFWTLWALRSKLGSKIPFFLHTHGEGTVGMTRLRELARLLSPQDVFLCASKAEAASIRVCFTKARTVVCPFPIFLPAKAGIRRNKPTARRLVYSGRISEQKNLHTLIVALSILRDRNPELRWELEVFGKPDGWGSPNMGFRMKDYPGFLRRLCRKLDLEDRVLWRGFMRRDRLDPRLARLKHLFVSASLHSDEDFGVAALKSIAAGHPAVLSAWGGHFDLARRFAGRVRLVPVYESRIGPFVDPSEFADRLLQAWDMRQSAATQAPADGLDRQARALAGFALRAKASNGRLIPSSTAARLWKRMRKLQPPKLPPAFERRRYPEQIFLDYRDRLACPFFHAYGARPPRAKVPAPKTAQILPWVRIEENRAIVDDPHRGALRMGVRGKGPATFRQLGLSYPLEKYRKSDILCPIP